MLILLGVIALAGSSASVVAVPAQTEADGYTRYELLAPGSAKFLGHGVEASREIAHLRWPFERQRLMGTGRQVRGCLGEPAQRLTHGPRDQPRDGAAHKQRHEHDRRRCARSR